MGDTRASEGSRPLLSAAVGDGGDRDRRQAAASARGGVGGSGSDRVGVVVWDEAGASDSDGEAGVGPAWDGFSHTSQITAKFPAPLRYFARIGAPKWWPLQVLLVLSLLARFVVYTVLSARGDIEFLMTLWIRTVSGVTSGIAAVWIRHRRLTHQVSVGDAIRHPSARKRFRRSLLLWGAGITGTVTLSIAISLKFVAPLIGEWILSPGRWLRHVLSSGVYVWEVCSMYFVIGVFAHDCSCVQRLRRHVADELRDVLLSRGTLANKLDGATRLHEALRKTTRVVSQVYSWPILLFVVPVFFQGLTGYVVALLLHSGSKPFGIDTVTSVGAVGELALVAVETMWPLLWITGGMALANSREGLSETAVFSAMRQAAHRDDSSSLGLEWGLLLDYLRSRRNRWRVTIGGSAMSSSDLRRLSASFAVSLLVLVARRSFEYGSQPSSDPSPALSR